MTIAEQSRQWHQHQREFFNRRPHQRMWYSPKDRHAQRMTERFVTFAGLEPGQQILEVGCGAGRFTIPLLNKGLFLTAFDISEGMIEQLNLSLQTRPDLADRCEVVRSGFEDLNVPDRDAVIGFNVLHHLFDARGFFERSRQWLKPGGQVAFLEPNAANILHALDSVLDRGWKVEQHKMQCRPGIFAGYLRESGFLGVRTECLGFFPPPMVNTIPGLSGLEERLEKVRAWNKALPFFLVKGTLA